jgi:hypothetical protein
VVLEPAGGLAGAQVPQTKVLVPGARESKVSVRGEDNVRDEMAVTMKPLLGNSVISGLVPVELPDERDLSLELERIMSGYLGLVVIWVTQPLWPLRVPLN